MTATEITAPGTYTVHFRGPLSGKRFRDAQTLVKDKLQGSYDPAMKTWTVTLDESDWDKIHGTSDMRKLRDAYGAIVAPATTIAVDRTALLAERAQLRQRLAEIDRLLAAIHSPEGAPDA